jgi:hypothetical protein
MNRSFSKIRHIQEANQRLEKRLMSEQVQQTGSTTPNTAQPFEELKKSLVGKKIQLFADTTNIRWPKGITEKEVPLFVVQITNLSPNKENKGIDFAVNDMRSIDTYGQGKMIGLETQTKDVYLGQVELLTMRCGSNGEFEYGKLVNGEIDQLPFILTVHLENNEEDYQNVFPVSRNLAAEIDKSNFCKSKVVNFKPDMQP